MTHTSIHACNYIHVYIYVGRGYVACVHVSAYSVQYQCVRATVYQSLHHATTPATYVHASTRSQNNPFHILSLRNITLR